MKILGIDYTIVYSYNDYDTTGALLENGKEIFHIDTSKSDENISSEEKIKNEVLKKKDEFLSYNITLEKNDDNFIAKAVEPNVKDIKDNNQVSSNDSSKLIFPLNSEYELVKEFGNIQTHNEEAKENETYIHTGTDYKVDSGADILATKSGEIIYSGYKGSYGNLVIIDHGDGMETYYAHCSELLKNQGEKVNAGDVIAKIGSTGNSTGPHLHFEIRINGDPVDPTSYMK